MHRYLLFLLFIPQFLLAQEPVKPVIANDYLLLIKGDSLNKSSTKKIDSIERWKLAQPYLYRMPIKGIRFQKGKLTIQPLEKNYIYFGGTFTSAIAVTSINKTPALQNQYAQGRTISGVPQWRGPETGEVFSYGPLVESLEYDGNPYPFDINGKLVGAGMGNGLNAFTFDNGIFRNGFQQNQLLAIRISQNQYHLNRRWNIGLKAGTSSEGMVIRDNASSSTNLSANFEAFIDQLSISGGYSTFRARFSNENRGGFLNRVYQNSLLTPVTFNNSESELLSPNVQRRYGNNTDNPYFLVGDNGHFSKNVQQTGNVSAKLKINKLTLGTSSTFEAINLDSDESLKTSTAFFENGFPLTREKNDRRFNFDGYASLAIKYGDWGYQSLAKLNYTRTQTKTDINYLPINNNYHYNRAVDELSATYQTSYDKNRIRAALNFGNKTYSSSTFTKGAYFLPNIDGFFQLNTIFGRIDLPIKISATYNKFYTEPSTSTSYAYYSSTQLTPDEAFRFLPMTEVSGFTQLQPTKNAEFTSKIEINSNYKWQFTGSYFIRNTKDEVFPVALGGDILLKNLANVHFNGFELELTQRNRWSKFFNFSHTLSFFKWTNKVNSVATGYDYTPIAGFANINKALVEGQPVGVLVGNSYLKDQNGNTVIGNDGFPIANINPSIVGNPIPDFTIKFSENFSFKERFAISLDWEYKKGGDVWNGTKAVLDYYGRSAASAIERTITGYVFQGVTTGGQLNTIPVSFYNPNQPISQSKWVRYRPTGVSTDYIQKADAVRLRNVSITYSLRIKKIAQKIRFTAYAKNLMIWSAYQGADPDQLMYDQANAQGLDFFNLPSTKTFGLNVSVQF